LAANRNPSIATQESEEMPASIELTAFGKWIEKEYDVDWDEIIATTEDDFRAGRFAFNSADYPSHEAAMEAMRKLIHDIFEKVLRENATAVHSLDAAR
jgi:hypothetical protein